VCLFVVLFLLGCIFVLVFFSFFFMPLQVGMEEAPNPFSPTVGLSLNDAALFSFDAFYRAVVLDIVPPKAQVLVGQPLAAFACP